MTEQGNLDGTGGDLSSHLSRQAQGYSMGTQMVRNMTVIDEMATTGVNTSSQGSSSVDRSGTVLDSLAPIFPPQNFEVPDISFSNSVIPNADFNQSLMTSAQMYGNSNTNYTNVSSTSSHTVGEQPSGSSHQQQGNSGVGGQPTTISSQQQATYPPLASRSPPGTSSSDDSDDLPLAQLVKRVTSGITASNTSLASPSTHSPDTTCMEGSPAPSVTPKKAKQTKRKKKKDPNEPQKPVSAYVLFFRDTQATIKGHNPNASFGEVSKIVASMWEQLDPEHKDVYKKKAEMAKKQYLKQLAAYRASQVSQSGSEEAEKSPSSPGLGSTSAGGMTGTTNFQAMEVVSAGSNIPASMSAGQQRVQIQQQSSAHLMQVPPQMMQHQMQQQQHHQQINVRQSSPSHEHSPPQEMKGPIYASPPHVIQASSNNYQPTMMTHNNDFFLSDQEVNMEVTYPHCVRSGCKNHARDNPAWDSNYCSNDCVITHCRDIFKTWVASRTGSNSYPVK
uniref:HMG box domain-containing protein n=1 Tax=Arion vulgaris TaxID=1028688 RepID=A0A0B6ZGR1_9EUPU